VWVRKIGTLTPEPRCVPATPQHVHWGMMPPRFADAVVRICRRSDDSGQTEPGAVMLQVLAACERSRGTETPEAEIGLELQQAAMHDGGFTLLAEMTKGGEIGLVGRREARVQLRHLAPGIGCGFMSAAQQCHDDRGTIGKEAVRVA
ncbi:hypothetical protein D7V97_43725, partial [Corallococcus sp. CA053C]